jgi:cyclopropane-fatty-acyl-phospholipid synthase
MNIEEKIKSEIRKSGYVTVDRFWQIALFDQEGGYYITRNPIGKDSDFITSPEISILFGEMVGIFIVNQVKEHLQKYDKINLIELGAGKGTWLNDILGLISKFPDIYQKLDVYILEINPVLVEIQKKTLNNHINRVNWVNDLGQITSNSPHIYICNEFFDALPVKQFQKGTQGIKERVIKLDNKDDFIYENIETKIPEILINDLDDFNENSIIEYSELSTQFMHKISDNILKHKGFAIIIDYGYSDFVTGDTIQSVKDHQYNNIFNNIGTSDITAHVNFRLLYFIAMNAGIKNIYLQDQGEFLKSMGIIQRAENISKNLNEKEKSDLFVRVNRLIDLSWMGHLFKFLIVENF